jgi:hypothetical protein
LLNDESSFDTIRVNNLNTQFIVSREYRLGYYTGVSGGIAMRFGILDPDNWPSYDVYQLNYAHGVIDPDKKLRAELYFQCSIKPHLVLYNAHLQGQFRKQKYEYISYPKINHFVVEGFAGVGVNYPEFQKKLYCQLDGLCSRPNCRNKITSFANT